MVTMFDQLFAVLTALLAWLPNFMGGFFNFILALITLFM